MSFIAACQNPVGMENPSIRNIRITSAGYLSLPNFARLNGRLAWCTTKQTYLQVNLAKRHQLTAIATQGGEDNTGIIRWVQKYKLGFFAGPRKKISTKSLEHNRKELSRLRMKVTPRNAYSF